MSNDPNPGAGPDPYRNPAPQTYGTPTGQTYGAPTGQTYGNPAGQTYGNPAGQNYGNPPPQQTYGTAAPQYGTPAYGSPPPPPPGTNGLSIAGLILAFLAAPIGFILSIIGLIQAGKRGQKGKGLAIAGIIISLLLMVGGVIIAATVATTVSKLADAGCTTGKSALVDNSAKMNDPNSVKPALQASIDGLDAAAAKATHADVKAAVTALADDYKQLLQDVNTGTPPDPALQTKIDNDAKKFDSLCSITTGN
jgi:hypothetical protein